MNIQRPVQAMNRTLFLYCDVLYLMSIHASSIILLDVREIYDIIATPNYR